MHGGKSTGPPKGTQNALKYWLYTKTAMAERKRVGRLMKNAKAFLNDTWSVDEVALRDRLLKESAANPIRGKR